MGCVTVGTCSECGEDLVLDRSTLEAVCGCGVRITRRFMFAAGALIR